MLNRRCVDILETLVKCSEVQSVDELSSRFGVSNRMIRYDIDSINNFLKENNITQIEKKPNTPLKLRINNLEKELILENISNLNTQTYILSTHERIGILLYELLSSKKECTYKDLQEKLSVSKTTIVSDIKKVKEWLINYKVQVVKIGNKGLMIEGEEKNIRKAITDLLVENNDYNIISALERLYNNQNKCITKNLNKVELSTENIEYIKGLIKELEESFGVFSDYDFMNLVISVYIIINRSSNKNPLKNISYDSIELDYRKEYSESYKIAKKLNEKFNINVDKEEISYLATNILSASKNDCNIFDSGDYFEACSIADALSFNIKEKYIPNFNMDSKLFEAFINHLKSLIFRLKFNIYTKNPIIESIKQNYKKEFDMIKSLSYLIEEKLNCTINDDELGYITMYICSAIEKTSIAEKSTIKNIIIACSSGFATGRLLESRIKNDFEVNVVGVTSVHNIHKYIGDFDIDYIISTVDINEKYSVPIIKVPAIFNGEEINKLKQYLNYKPILKNNTVVDDILDIIEDNCEIVDKSKLINSLNKYFKVDTREITNIRDYIDSSSIQLDIDTDDWKEGIRISALPLLRKGAIEEEYIQAIIDNVDRFGAYIVVDDGIAIPHAKPDKYVNDFGISINTFKRPIEMGEHKNIKIFITISSINNESHINLITQIMKLIEDDDVIERITNAKTPKDVIAIL